MLLHIYFHFKACIFIDSTRKRLYKYSDRFFTEKNSTRIHTANAQMKKNTRMFSSPLFKMPNVGDSERRSTRSDRKNVSGVDPTTINLQDLVSGKLDNSKGLLVGTLKKSMKILSNRKPTTYYYFETKGRNPKENRQL